MDDKVDLLKEKSPEYKRPEKRSPCELRER